MAENNDYETGMNAGFFVSDDQDAQGPQQLFAELLLADAGGFDQSQPRDGASSVINDDGCDAGDSAEKEETAVKMLDLLFQATGSLAYSSLAGGGQMVGGKGSVVVAPVVRFDDTKTGIFLYSGAYRKTKQVFVQDEGPKMFSEDIVQNVMPTFRYTWSPKLIVSPSIVFTQVQTKETAEDTWNNGLYNYRDLGGGVKFEYLFNADPKEKQSVSFGIQRFRREYPNFKSLAFIAGYGNFEEREKDFDGTLITVSKVDKSQLGWSNTIKTSFLDKRYVDKLVENETGGRDQAKQYDYNLRLNDELLYKTGTGWVFSLGTSLAYTKSNQNMAEGAFPQIIFHRNYYSSYSATLRPGVSLTQRRASGHFVTYGIEYGITSHNYLDRMAKDRNGALLADTQVDWTHNLTVQGIYTLNKHWNLGLTMDYSKVTSNMKYEQLYRYNYEIVNISAGFSCRY
ncbi:MAG: hypothetical protein OEL66_01910 [Desulfobulbaceae bacterium]|nr:hypothetical protein [Desulfobulbaceae bacterium]